MYIKGFIVGVVLVILIFCLLVFGARCWLDYKRECLADERLQGPGGTDPGEYVAVNMSLCVKSW